MNATILYALSKKCIFGMLTLLTMCFSSSELCAASSSDDDDDESPFPPLERHRSAEQDSQGDEGSREGAKDYQWITNELDKWEM